MDVILERLKCCKNKLVDQITCAIVNFVIYMYILK